MGRDKVKSGPFLLSLIGLGKFWLCHFFFSLLFVIEGVYGVESSRFDWFVLLGVVLTGLFTGIRLRLNECTCSVHAGLECSRLSLFC